MNNIMNCFNTLIVNMGDISNYFDLLSKNINKTLNNENDNLKKNFDDFKNIFNFWSTSIKKQSEYFNEEFRENFNFMALEIDGMNLIYQNYFDFKSEFIEYNSMINERKIELFNSQNYEKWGVKPGTEDTINSFKDNKKEAFEKMLYKENLLLNEERKRLVVTIYKMNRQFDKLMKLQNEKIKNIYESLKKAIKIEFIKE